MLITKCTLDNNRRQGISLCAAMSNVRVDSCRITNTGKTNGTLPCAGIDVEPISFFAVIKDLTISNCYYKGNQGQAIDYNGYYYNENISIQNCYCEVDGKMMRQTEGILLLGALNNFVIRNCNFPVFNISGNKIEEVSRYPHNTILVEDCSFNIAYISNNQDFKSCDVTFDRCAFEKGLYSYWKDVATLTLNLPIAYTFNKCTIKGGNKIDIINAHRRSVNLYFNDCIIDTPLPFTVTKGIYTNNTINCSFVDIAAQNDISFVSNKVITFSKTQRIRLSNMQNKKIQLSSNIIAGVNDNILGSESRRNGNLYFNDNKWDSLDGGEEMSEGIVKNIRSFFERSGVDNSAYYDELITIEKFSNKMQYKLSR